MASLIIPCPACGHQLHLPDENYLGRNGRCPACDEKFLMERRLIDDAPQQQPADGRPADDPTESIPVGAGEPEQFSVHSQETHPDREAKQNRAERSPETSTTLEPAAAAATPLPDPSLAETERNPLLDVDGGNPRAREGDSVSFVESHPFVESQQSQLDSPAGDEQDVPQQLGRYRVLELIGQGSMGAVYRAHDTELDRHVALKIPSFSDPRDQEEKARFYREARAAATLRHPNICQVFDIGESGGCHFIAMEHVKGNPLTTFIKQQKPQPVRKIASTIRKLAKAMQQAHDRGLVHRDLKPDNIMIDERGEPIIMDFGLVRLMNDDDRLTNSGAIVGSPAYMSPEQVAGEQADVGPPSDVYSLGVITYELLTRRRPFRGSLAIIFDQIEQVDPQPPSELRPEIDAAFESICLKMMAKKVGERYASMTELADAINDYLKSPAVAVRRDMAHDRPARPSAASPPPATCPDTEAARWILKVGGKIKVSTDESPSIDVPDVMRLPAASFRVIEADLVENGRVDDDGLKQLSTLDGLLVLRLSETGVTDEGLSCLSGLTALQELNLSHTKITDAGLKHLRALNALKQLDLAGTAIGDAGLVHLKRLGKLQFLGLYATAVTDTGLKTLAGLKSLQFLGLYGTGVTDAGVAKLKKLLRNCTIRR